jgi:sugar lactone lactonase YvrE
MKKFICLMLAVVMLAGMFPLNVFATGPTHYTYAYNEWSVPIPSPDAYRVTAYILGQHLEFNGESIGAFHEPRDLHVHENLLYVADSGNNRIVILQFNEDTSYEVVDIRTHVIMNGDVHEFNNPYGIYVSPWEGNYGQIWIADTDNQRILHLDEDWNVINVILHPGIHGTSLLGPESGFLPEKLAVDFSGRLFVQVRHVNRGLMEFDRYGEFAGYMGAPPVTIGLWDQFWRLIATQEQRGQMLLVVPVEYNNVSIDHEGFIFVTTSSPNVEPVLRLNAMGDDIMIRNGWADPSGDLWWGTGADRSGPSELVAVTALPNNTFVVFDRNRGRLFAYDTQGEMIYAWGGPGNREGFFTFPTALDNMGHTLFALDAGIGSQFSAITRFDLTEYGTLINEALEMYQRGQYEESYDTWNDVLRINGNFGMAYIGIARARLRQGNYREAMHYFRLQNDFRNYGRAFGFYRRIWMEENFWMFAAGLGVLMIVPPIVKKVIKVRREIRES